MAKSLSFTGVGKSFSYSKYLTSQICILTLFSKIKFSWKYTILYSHLNQLDHNECGHYHIGNYFSLNLCMPGNCVSQPYVSRSGLGDKKFSLYVRLFLPKHIDTGYLLNATPPTNLSGSFWKFAGVFVKFLWCAWHLAVVLIKFCHFFRSLSLVIFGSTSTKTYRHWYLVNATPPTILARSFWNFAGGFVKVWGCAWR